jgi:nucleotide-binding universal stress UspA family protein
LRNWAAVLRHFSRDFSPTFNPGVPFLVYAPVLIVSAALLALGGQGNVANAKMSQSPTVPGHKGLLCRSAAHWVKESNGTKGASMKKFEKILAPTDLSEISRIGLTYAFDLARGWGAELTVYHVTDAAELANYRSSSLQDLIEKREKALSQHLSEHFPELLPLVEVRTKVDVGSAPDKILAEAEKQGSDLIVMSTHGRTGLAHMLMGSVTEYVVRNASCPVFSVHPPRAK